MVAVNEQRQDLLIDFRDVSVTRGGATILGPVTWQVGLGERWVIVGPNGAGKTTLVNIASAGEYPSRGQVRILGERLGRTDLRDLRTAIGISSSALAHRIPGEEKVGDLVVSAGYAVLGRWRERYDEQDFERAHEILEQVGAMHLIERRWGTLSEGERKRVLLARALMIDPEILILDEPTAAMDLGGREDLVAHLSELAEDPTSPATVMITHHVEEIPQGFTHSMLLDEGAVVAQGPIEQVLTSENLTRTFHQSIELTEVEGRYFARRTRRGGSHRHA
ncbi:MULTISPECIES: ABC transporter ATP-binding protein [unclassified Corynebacterium]|uniref:ABC transporter ATP-binding protein n=1 Tax=unclassified Corynebacterium TaxID=2624378 RepID=UPI0029CA9778|nr:MULTISPECIES: ABC transporter ATP-binding protein [unclassified Corynebacterium]WPF67023.1 ABC transporter ATP-binding protein [Corynebacterium sp. 22KM0430]WPF69511.1 ABC transporter ATP-binding protein [Corynebacterium sp. 21KM1197]